MPVLNKEYFDPLHIVWRKGTADDPYTDKVELLKVSNQTAVLSEIPDTLYRVRINNFQEVELIYNEDKILGENQFSVNYQTGVVYFGKQSEGLQLNFIYKGKGFIQYPAERIYYFDGKNNVVRTLDDLITDTNDKIADMDGKLEYLEDLNEELIDSISKANVATDMANQATERCEVATDKALDAYETTRLVFKPYVNDEKDIRSTYPHPEIGWTTQVYKTGIRYRFDGVNWVAIDIFGGNIPTASEHLDGLMSKEDKIKLDDISDDVDIRTMIFVYPFFQTAGAGAVNIKTPHDGKILSVKAFCGIPDDVAQTKLNVQRSIDMVEWEDILVVPVTIDIGEHFDNGLQIVDTNKNTMKKDEIYRVMFSDVGTLIQNVTIEMKFKVN